MSLSDEIMKSNLLFRNDGKFIFPRGTIVTVKQPINGYHLVDRGMLSGEVLIPLIPGDRLEYLGPHIFQQIAVSISIEQADEILERIPKELERSWVNRNEFFVYLQNDGVNLLNDS